MEWGLGDLLRWVTADAEIGFQIDENPELSQMNFLLERGVGQNTL